MDKVVILIISHKAELSIYEQISLRQCYNILGSYPIKIICPYGLDVSRYKEFLPNPQFDFIDPVWQSNYANFNRLKVEPFLYNRYSDYQYTLFYEPDAFVFSNELDYWCNAGYDYIGAPWFEGFCEADENSSIVGMGNGGFSLRNNKNSLKILKQLKTVEILNQYSKFSTKITILKFLRIYYEWMKNKDQLPDYVKNFKENEDLFWTIRIQEQIVNFKRNNNILSRIYRKFFFHEFNIAPTEDAIEFSFENLPKKLYNINHSKLPFGCHAWFKYDYEFWKPFIEKYCYELP